MSERLVQARKNLINRTQGGYETHRNPRLRGPQVSPSFFKGWTEDGFGPAWQTTLKKIKRSRLEKPEMPCSRLPAELSLALALIGGALSTTGARRRAENHEGNRFLWPTLALLTTMCLTSGDWGFPTKTTKTAISYEGIVTTKVDIKR